MNTTIYSLPSHWASYLINADSSGLESQDIADCDSTTKYYGSCAGCSEESYFGRFKGMGCDLSDFTFIDQSQDVR